MRSPHVLLFFLSLLLLPALAGAQIRTGCGNGTFLSLVSGDINTVTCAEESQAGLLTFQGSSNYMPYVVVAIDADNIIRAIEARQIDFGKLPAGNYRVRGLYFVGGLLAEVGMNADTAQLAGFCFGFTENKLEIGTVPPDGGLVSDTQGRSERIVCNAGDVPEISLQRSSSNPNYVYLVTDTNDDIIQIIEDGQVDPAELPAGLCRIYGLSYAGALQATVGLNVRTDQLASACFDLSDNAYELFKTLPEAGRISLTTGESSALICEGLGQIDFRLNGNDPLSSTAFILTGKNNVVTRRLSTNQLDASTLNQGKYRIYGVSFTGTLDVEIGAPIESALAAVECFDRTDNFVSLTIPVITATEPLLADGSQQTIVCAQRNSSTIVTLQAPSPNNFEETFVLTDTSGLVLDISTSTSIDAADYGPEQLLVRSLAYSGNLLVQPGDNVRTAQLSDECADLSSTSVAITRKFIAAGTIALLDGSDQALICFGPALEKQVQFTVTNANAARSALVITDENDQILELADASELSINNSFPSPVRVRHLAYSGNLNQSLEGAISSANFSDECFELSDNFVRLQTAEVDGGKVSLPDGNERISICGMDEDADILAFQNNSTAPFDYAYVLTDSNNAVTFVLIGNSIDFNVAQPGRNQIFGVSYTGNLLINRGDTLSQNTVLSDNCYELSSNAVTVTVEEVRGGSVQLDDQTQQRFICGEGQPDVLTFETSGSSTDAYAYLITNTDNQLLDVADGNNYNFDQLSNDTLLVYGVAYTGTLNNLNIGNVQTDVLSTACFDLSVDRIRIIKTAPEGGSVALENGSTERFLCPGDDNSLLRFTNSGASPDAYLYMVTDTQDVLQRISVIDSLDFNLLPEQDLRIYGLAYNGIPLLQPGDAIFEVALTDDCFAISDNFIAVRRQNPTGGAVQYADGSVQKTVCPDAGPASVFFSTSGNDDVQIQYFLTDTNNTILEIPESDSLPVASLALGTYRIHSLVYQGELQLNIGDTLGSTPAATACTAFADNFLSLLISRPEGGTISILGSAQSNICVNNLDDPEVRFTHDGTQNSNYAYLITNDKDQLLLALDQMDAFTFDFFFAGTLRVYSVAYTGSLTVQAGQDVKRVALAEGCFSLSDNRLQVLRDEVDGGRIQANGSEDGVFVCPDDDQPDLFTFANNSSAASANYAYVITNSDNLVFSILQDNQQDFENTGFRNLRVWGISYTGALTLRTGQILTEATVSDACFDLSANFLDVVREEPDGGSISSELGEGSIRFCPTPEVPALRLSNTSSTGAGYLYLILEAGSDRMLASSRDGLLSTALENVSSNQALQVVGLSYTGNLTFSIGDTLRPGSSLSDNCHELSSNRLDIEIGALTDAGRIGSTVDGDTYFACANDGVADVIAFEEPNSFEGDSYQFIITDQNNEILIPEIVNPVIDFDRAVPGIYRVWGLAVEDGPFNPMFGEQLGSINGEQTCYDVSANFIEVRVDETDGATVSDALSGATQLQLANADTTLLFSNSSSSLLDYGYLFTDSEGILLKATLNDSFNLRGLPDGTYQVYGISFAGTFDPNLGAAIDTATFSSSCFELSTNTVDISIGDNAPTFSVTFNGGRGTTGGAPDNRSSSREDLQQELQLSVSPNPTRDEIQVAFQMEALQDRQIKYLVFDSNGKVVLQGQTAAAVGQQKLRIDLRDLDAGMYVLRVIGGPQIGIHRIVKINP